MEKEELQIIFDAIWDKIENHLPTKGDTWRTCDIRYLVDKLSEEINEMCNPNEERFLIDPTEIPDVMLVLSFIYLRYLDIIE